MDQIKNKSNTFYENWVSILPKDLSEFAETSSEDELQKMNGSTFQELIVKSLNIKRYTFNTLSESIYGLKEFTFDDFLKASVLV